MERIELDNEDFFDYSETVDQLNSKLTRVDNLVCDHNHKLKMLTKQRDEIESLLKSIKKLEAYLLTLLLKKHENNI